MQATNPQPKAKKVTISSSTPTVIYNGLCKGAQVKALNANTGIIYIGAGNVDANESYDLNPGESIYLPYEDLQLFRALAAVNNEKICYLIVT